jgi:transposase
VVIEGATARSAFEAYVGEVLGPTLVEGQVVILDNLGTHKGDRVRELIEGRGCKLLFLPPYSPDFNPVEEAFSKIKALLRNARARSRGAYEKPSLERLRWLAVKMHWDGSLIAVTKLAFNR